MEIVVPFNEVFSIRIVKFTKYRELIELTVLSLISFLIPVFIGHPQIFVGIVVNALIVRSALTMKSWKNLPTILLPSLGVLMRGVLFGPFTFYLLYLILFIWLGNFVLAYFTKVFSKVRSKLFIPITIIISSALKALVIFLPTLFLVSSEIIPKMFLKPMGIIQFVTALIGGMIALAVTQLEMKIYEAKS